MGISKAKKIIGEKWIRAKLSDKYLLKLTKSA